MATAVFEVGAALLGACVGSFLNVVIYRVPQRRSLGGRSHCPHCGAQIPWFDNVPVLAWLWLGGKGRCCKQPIAFRYPLVELLTAFLFLALMLWPAFGPVVTSSPAGPGIDVDALAAFGYSAVFMSLLVALTFIDFDTQLLPDVLTLPGVAIGLLAGLWPGLAGHLTSDAAIAPAMSSLLASGLGALTGYGVTWVIRAVGSIVFKKEAMGFGDVKLMAMIGAFVGWQAALLTMFLGCVFGAIVGASLALAAQRPRHGDGGKRGFGQQIPFGPYLALGAVVSWFGRDPILHALFETWPDWQRRHPDAQWVLLLVALGSLSALFFLVRRARRSG